MPELLVVLHEFIFAIKRSRGRITLPPALNIVRRKRSSDAESTSVRKFFASAMGTVKISKNDCDTRPAFNHKSTLILKTIVGDDCVSRLCVDGEMKMMMMKSQEGVK